jgi:hypothetical protein
VKIARKNDLKNEQSFLRESLWFCLCVHRIFLLFFFFHKNCDIVRVCIFVSFFLLSVKRKYFAFQFIYKNFVPKEFLSKGIFF